MSATEPRLAARSRWSSAARCPRQASYGLLGVPPEEERLREDVRRLMRVDLDGLRRRGKRIGAARAEQYAAKYGEANIIREKEIPWPGGTAHGDIFVIPERLAVEVKSVMPGSLDTVFDAAVLQCAGQVVFDDDADVGLVEFVSPVDETVYEAVPVILNQELVARVKEIAHAVARAGMSRGVELPARVCERPGDSPARLCPFAAHCFADWQPPELVELDDPETVLLVRELCDAKRRYREHSAEAEACKKAYAAVQEQLSGMGFEPGRDYMVDGVKVRRIVAKGRESFSLAKARSTGNWTALDDERFGPFLSVGSESERWSVDRVASSTFEIDDAGTAPF